jgi:anti-sigma B factor antagonist
VSFSTVKSHVEGDVLVVEPEGALDLYTVGALRRTFTEAFEAGHTHLVVVLNGVDLMDSSGLGVLVGALKAARVREGSVRLVCTQPLLLQTLRLTGLDKVFMVRASVQEVVSPPSSTGLADRHL